MIKAGIVGGTGYTGVELLRLLAQHPQVELRAITSRKEAGTPVADMFPSLRGRVDLAFTEPKRRSAARLRRGVLRHAARRGDERGARAARRRRACHRPLRGFPHPGPRRVGALVQDEARRARARRARRCTACRESTASASAGARLVANPGCYPTAMQLGFLPLVEAGVVDLDHLIADAKSGVSGAGRKAELHLRFSEASDNFMRLQRARATGTGPRSAQGLAQAARREVGLVFTAAPDADDPRHPRDALRAHYDARPISRQLFEKRYAKRAVRRRDARRAAIPTRARCAPRTCAASPCTGRRRARKGRHAGGAVGDRQPGQGRRGPGGAEHEPDVRPAGDGGPRPGRRWCREAELGPHGKLRQRFGIAAPRVDGAVRRCRGTGAGSASRRCSASLPLRRPGSTTPAGASPASTAARCRRSSAASARELDAARSELERLRAVANAADSRLSIERTAQQKLAQQIRTLEQDNARLREELAHLREHAVLGSAHRQCARHLPLQGGAGRAAWRIPLPPAARHAEHAARARVQWPRSSSSSA